MTTLCYGKIQIKEMRPIYLFGSLPLTKQFVFDCNIAIQYSFKIKIWCERFVYNFEKKTSFNWQSKNVRYII